jgi:2'-hydroxyisoflavone reductase
MKLLILGGTRFVGRNLVMAALERGHEITLFNRGQHAPEQLANIERIQGDRNKDLNKLRGRRWDAAVDTSGYLPRTVKASAETLVESVDRYVFVSSQSVYADASQAGIDETAPVATLTSEQLDRANSLDSSGQASALTYGEMYGGLKALCEQTVEKVFPARALIVRPGVVVGPHDYSDRFTYWVVRISSGGEVLAPGRADRHVQFIDARDLGEWTVSMIERKETGIYNATGSPQTVTMRNLLEVCREVTGAHASFTWVSEDFLMKEGVTPWSKMPLWIPEEDERLRGYMLINCDKAIRAGLRWRALNDTIKDTFTWYKTSFGNEPLKAGIDSATEEALLRKWHESH